MAAEALVREVFIEAPPEEVFPYLTQADKYVLWMGLSAQLDARPGGIYEVDPNTRDIIRGEFIEVVPPRKLVFSWGFKEPGRAIPAGATRVTIELIARDGGTLVRLVHEQLPAGVRVDHERGWAHYLGRLKVLLAGADPGTDPFSVPSLRHGERRD